MTEIHKLAHKLDYNPLSKCKATLFFSFKRVPKSGTKQYLKHNRFIAVMATFQLHIALLKVVRIHLMTKSRNSGYNRIYLLKVELQLYPFYENTELERTEKANLVYFRILTLILPCNRTVCSSSFIWILHTDLQHPPLQSEYTDR